MNIFTTLRSINRLRNSPDGNPRYSLDCEDGNTYLTKQDSQINHVLSNTEYTDMIGERVYLVTERAPDGSRLVYAVRPKDPKDPESVVLTDRQRQLAMCVMTNGYELGIGYWVEIAKDVKRDDKGDYYEFTLKGADYDEPNPWFTVTVEKVWAALKRAATDPEFEGSTVQEVARIQLTEDRRLGPGHTGADCYLASTWADAGTDDAVIQIACFGTIVYG